jgi:hypothetical protein
MRHREARHRGGSFRQDFPRACLPITAGFAIRSPWFLSQPPNVERWNHVISF